MFKQPYLNLAVDSVMAVSFIVTTISAFIRSRIHPIAGTIFIIMVLLHLTLHLRWVVSVTKSIFRKK